MKTIKLIAALLITIAFASCGDSKPKFVQYRAYRVDTNTAIGAYERIEPNDEQVFAIGDEVWVGEEGIINNADTTGAIKCTLAAQLTLPQSL